MKILLLPVLLCSLLACSQNKNRQPLQAGARQNNVAIPLGKYSVYQSGSYGSFNYQYAFYLLNNHQYKMDDQAGEYSYSPATNVLRFTSGNLKDYTGIYTHVKYNNDTGGPMIVLDFWGKGDVPDTLQLKQKPSGNYQYAYYRANEK